MSSEHHVRRKKLALDYLVKTSALLDSTCITHTPHPTDDFTPSFVKPSIVMYVSRPNINWRLARKTNEGATFGILA